MQRYQHYFRQKVTADEFNDAFDAVENAINALVESNGYAGSVNDGADVTEHSPTADLTVDVAAGIVYDQQGQRMAWSGVQNVDMSLDENGASTAVTSSGYEKYLSLFAEFDRNLTDPRTDGNGDTLFYDQAESFNLNVVQGTQATTGTATKPALRSDQVLLCDVLITYGMTQIQDADIDSDRTEISFNLTGSPLSIREKNLQDALQAVVDEINAFTTDLFTIANTWTAKQTFSASVPILLTPAASPALANDGELAYDSTSDDRLVVRVNGVSRDIVQAQLSRTVRIGLATGLAHNTDDWYFGGGSNQTWYSQVIDGSDYFVSFPLNGFIPQYATLDEIRVSVYPVGTSSGTDRISVEVRKSFDTIFTEYHDGTADYQTIVISSIATVFDSKTFDFSIRIRSQRATSTSGACQIAIIKAIFTDGNFARVP